MSRSTRLVSVVAASAFAASVFSFRATARAQPSKTVVVRSERAGLTAGVGFGVGHLGCADNDCDAVNEAAGLNFHVGAMVAPRLAVVADVWGMTHRDNRVTLSQSLVTGALRYWPLPRLWVAGGLGIARASFRYDVDVVDFENTSDSVLGYLGAVGLEAVSSDTFALDVALRAGTGVYDEDEHLRNVAVTVGASWY